MIAGIPGVAAVVASIVAPVVAVLGAWLGPGYALVVALGAGRDRLERFALAVACGRLLLAAVSLAACSASAPQLLVGWGALGAALGAHAWWRMRGANEREGAGGAVAVAIACAVLLVFAVVGRSALSHDGALAFFGRDSANDPFVYGAYANALRERGLPLANPFAGGDLVPGSYVLFAALAGLSSMGGASMLDLVFRVLPLLDTIALGVTAIALVRALGAPKLAWFLAPALTLLGGDPSPWLGSIGRLFGVAVQRLDSWSLFGPYLLAFNPIAAGLQTLFCAYLLLARGAAIRRRDAILAGLLVGALIEIKLFLWAPAIAALFAVAVLWPPPATRIALLWSAAAAALVSLPSMLEKALSAQATSGRGDTGFALCIACFPRYLANAAWGNGDLSFAIFRSGSAMLTVHALIACVVIGALALGARALALGELVRGARSGATAIVYRQLAIGAALGFALAFGIATPPHHLNAAQFTWIATYGLWPLLAIAAARWLQTGRWLPIAVATMLFVPGSLDTLLRLGWGAPQTFTITRDERDLAVALQRMSAPEAVVFEPSMLASTDRPSWIPLLAGRPVELSLLSAVMSVPDAEREARFGRIATFFAGDDTSAALRALRASGAAFVFVPRGAEPRNNALDALEEVEANGAGRLLRVGDWARVPAVMQAPAPNRVPGPQ